ncbi:unnamed protein product [Cylindrotheca closterium]|uniref:VWFD domain-containing protein n=1 Tax=Cylindrotheca closterium TaxID=2856 RepID=A0AAD2CKP1_9STRA|nr:unnamed protein product [Cylindrotheca closterium]
MHKKKLSSLDRLYYIPMNNHKWFFQHRLSAIAVLLLVSMNNKKTYSATAQQSLLLLGDDKFDYSANNPLPSAAAAAASASSKCALLNLVVDETDSMKQQTEWLKQRAIPQLVKRLHSGNDGYYHYDYDLVFVCGNGFGKTGSRRSDEETLLYRFMGCTIANANGTLQDDSVAAWDHSAKKPQDGWLAMRNAMEHVPAEIEGIDLLATCQQKLDRTLILLTDNDRDDETKSLTLEGLKNLISQNGYILDAIVKTEIDDDLDNFALKISDSSGDQNTIFTADGNGGWTTQSRNEAFVNFVDGYKDTPEDYIPFVVESRGMVWNGKSLEHGIRENPSLLESFTNHFVQQKVDQLSKSQATGDPHITTWKNEHFEYHGQCDLVMMKDPNFADGLGLDVHIRTKIVRYWSYIKSVAIRIGNDILEIEGSADTDDSEAHYWINYEYQGELESVAGFPVTQTLPSVYKRRYTIDLSSKYYGNQISIHIFNEFVSVAFGGGKEAFGNTVGLLGDFDTGKTLARDGVTVMHDFTDLGDEWQVLASEPNIFHEMSEPQFPNQCIHPEDPNGDRKRRLLEADISLEQAEEACAILKDPLFIKDCTFDVMATQDLAMVGAY